MKSGIASTAPSLVNGLVHRPRLLRRMPSADIGLTVIAAPAGYGKSALVAQWHAFVDPKPVAWVTPRRADNAARVAARLWAAATRLGVDVSTAIPAWAPQDDDELGPRLIETLAEYLSSARGTLVIDGLDAPSNESLSAELLKLSTRIAPNLRVVVTQRSRWVPSGSLRASVLTTRHLAFTAAEAKLLVENTADGAIDPHDLAMLVEAAHGWPIALKTAAIALRGAPDPARTIAELGSNDRRIEAYFDAEVLQHQPHRVRTFLSRCSVLDVVTPAAATAVTGDAAAGMMLRFLARRGAFVTEDAGDLFRLHPMLRAFLRGELRGADPTGYRETLSRAATWFSRHAQPEAAAACLIEAEQWHELLQLVDLHTRSMYEQELVPTLLEWLDAIPTTGRDRWREIALRKAYLLTMIGETHRSEQVVRTLEAAGLRAGEQVAIDTLRASWVFDGGSPVAALQAAEQALAALDRVATAPHPRVVGINGPNDLRVLALGAKALAQWHLGAVAEARSTFAALLDQRLYSPWLVRTAGSLAMLEAWSGNLRAAERTGRHALAIAAAARVLDHPTTMDARLALAAVARERGELGRAVDHLEAARPLVRRGSRSASAAIAAIENALLCLAMGDPDAGLSVLDAEVATGPGSPPVVERRVAATRLRLLIARGDADRADAMFDDTTSESVELSTVGAAAAIALGRIDSARTRLASSSNVTETRDRIEHDLWTAIVRFEEGNRRDAVNAAASVLAVAERDQQLRVFADGGKPATRLLRAVRHAAPTPYARHLVDATTTAPPAVASPLGLSVREQEVVRYLPTPLSSAEIAAQLYISLNTLKTHLRSIYRKLEVNGRRDAIGRAEELGLA